MRASMAGDEVAYRRLLTDLTPYLRAYARAGLSRAGRSTGEAEDVVQDTLMAIHLKRSSWRAGDALLPWVRGIARYKLIDALRRRGAVGDIDIDDMAEAIAAPVEEPAIETRDVMRLAASLPEGQRRVIGAMFVEGLDTAATAETLGMSEGAVRVALHRGLQRLAMMMKGQMSS